MKSKSVFGFSRRKAALINLLFNYTNTLFVIVTGIFMVPLYLHYFNLSTYGAWLASGNILSLLSILDGGTNLVFSQRLASSYGKQDLESFSSIVGSGLCLIFTLCFMIGILGLGISFWIPIWVKADSTQYFDLSLGFILAALGTGLSIASSALGAILQAWQLTFVAGVITLASIIISLISITAGLFCRLGVASLGLGLFAKGITSFLLLAFFIVYHWKQMNLPKPLILKSNLTDLVLTTIPVMVARSGGIIINSSQSLIVAIFVNSSAAAILALTGRVYDACTMFLSPIGSSVFAGIGHISGDNDSRKLYDIISRLLVYMTAASALTLGLALCINESIVGLWVGNDKYGGFALSTALFFNAAILARLNFISLMLTATGEIGKTAYSSLIEMSIRLPLIFLLLKEFGVIGLPLASVFSSLIIGFPVLNWLLIKRLSLIPKQSISIVLSGIHLLIIVFLFALFNNNLLSRSESWIQLAAVICADLIFILSTLFLLSPITKSMLLSLFKSISRIKIKSFYVD